MGSTEEGKEDPCNFRNPCSSLRKHLSESWSVLEFEATTGISFREDHKGRNVRSWWQREVKMCCLIRWIFSKACSLFKKMAGDYSHIGWRWWSGLGKFLFFNANLDLEMPIAINHRCVQFFFWSLLDQEYFGLFHFSAWANFYCWWNVAHFENVAQKY